MPAQGWYTASSPQRPTKLMSILLMNYCTARNKQYTPMQLYTAADKLYPKKGTSWHIAIKRGQA
jgi:hypothetical protein